MDAREACRAALGAAAASRRRKRPRDRDGGKDDDDDDGRDDGDDGDNGGGEDGDDEEETAARELEARARDLGREPGEILGTIADAVEAGETAQGTAILGVLAAAPAREGAALTLKDASTLACKRRGRAGSGAAREGTINKPLAKLLVRDAGNRRAVAVVLSERARRALAPWIRCDGLVVLVTSFTVQDFWQPKPETGLLGGVGNAGRGARHANAEPPGYAWADFPAAPIEQSCVLHGRYLEVDDLVVISNKPSGAAGAQGESVKVIGGHTEADTDHAWSVRAVSPIIQARREDQPYALVHAVDNAGEDRYIVLRSGVQTLAATLRPADQIRLLDRNARTRQGTHYIANGSRAKQYLTITASTQLEIIAREADADLAYTASEGSSAVSYDLSKECAYIGRISRRVGAFVLELDEVTKLFLTHVPPPAGGRGLCVGATVRLDNVFPMFFHGVFAGFVMTMRSTISIVHFASGDHRRSVERACVRMSPSQQAMLPSELGALTSYWFLSSLLQFSRQLMPRALRDLALYTEVRAFLEHVAANSSSDARSSGDGAGRDIWDEFMGGDSLGLHGQAQVERGRPVAASVSLPTFASVEVLKQGVCAHIRKNGMCKLPRARYGVKDMHGENHFLAIAAEVAVQTARQPVALVGWIGSTETTGQLVFRDRTGSIEIRVNSLLQQIVDDERDKSTPIAVALASCCVAVEALHLRTQENLQLVRRSPREHLVLWDDQYVDAQAGHEAVFRMYLEAAEVQRLHLDSRPFKAPRVAAGVSFEASIDLGGVPSFAALLVSCTPACRPTRDPMIAEAVLKLWSVKLGYVDVVCRTGQFPQFWSLLREGQVYRVEGLKLSSARPGARAVDTHVYEATKVTKFFVLDASIRQAQREEFWKRRSEAGFTLDQAQDITSVFHRSPSARTLWSLEGIVSMISLREGRQPQRLAGGPQAQLPRYPALLDRCTGIFLELRDVNAPIVLGVYISDIARVHLPPGMLRIGSKLTVFNPEIIQNGQKVYCRITTTSRVRVDSVLAPCATHIPLPRPLKSLEVCTLADALLRGLSAPQEIAFANIFTGVAQVSYVLAERRCRLCGWSMGGAQACPKGCVVQDDADAFEVITKGSFLLDDGTGQGQLSIDGPMTLQLLGMDNRQDAMELRNLTRVAAKGKVLFQSRDLRPQEADPREPPAAKAQRDFERLVMSRQLAAPHHFHVFAKCKHNLSKDTKTMFHREQAYLAPIKDGANETVKTASLPKLVLIGLHVERVDDAAALARELLFS